MIKVNLLRNVGGLAKVSEAGDAIGGPALGSVSAGLDKSAQIMIISKVVAILIFPLALIIYEKMSINDIESRVEQISLKIQQLKVERAKFGDAGPKIEKYNKEKQRIDKELETVRGIARNRLREVKTLDAIQSLMPGKAWAKKVAFKGSVVDLEGFSDGDDGVTDLIRALEGNPIFSKVEVRYTTSESSSSGSPDRSTGTKKFELQFRIGKQD